MEQAKLDKVASYPCPKSIKDVRAFLGLCNYYRRFVKGFANIARPLNELLQKDTEFQWTEECSNAFNTLRKHLTSEPIVLKFPDFSKQFILYTDASDYAIGYVFGQKDDDNKEHVIAYSGRSYRSRASLACTWKECLALIEGIKHFKPYLERQRISCNVRSQVIGSHQRC